MALYGEVSSTILPAPHQFNDCSSRCRWIDLTKASEDDFKDLSEACDPATFGRNREDILDETYRSAGKLDRAQFSIGPGQFFKAHKDTPRSTNMFASLVVVLPTVHEGGALLFRHEDRSFTFDSAQTLADAPQPSVAFTAFFSDVEHEVAPVTAGYRVTLTYNLYFDQIVSPVSVPVLSGLDMAVRDVLTKMLADPECLPKGGYIGFALRHEYALAEDTWADSLKTLLKGSDAVVEQLGEVLGLETSLWIAYEVDDEYLDETLIMLCPERASFPGVLQQGVTCSEARVREQLGYYRW
ncbi:hypothetical protein BC629DRAFT_1439686 [Irpex lacteus]|nr:hypothetical protein BC629DRAFT_1439686 [Irpex lacteus]